MTKEEQIVGILEKFNFGMVSLIMESINWWWSATDGKPPSSVQLRDSARKRLAEMAKKDDSRHSYIASGGLRAENRYGKLGLFFVLEGVSVIDRGDGTLTVF